MDKKEEAYLALLKEYSPWPSNIFLKLLAAVWSLPYGLIGFIAILFFKITGHHIWISPTDGGIDIIVHGWYAERKAAQNWAAITLGWCMFYWGNNMYVNDIRVHERVHVRQALLLGILMPLVYLICGLIRGYNNNPLEIQARRVEHEYKSRLYALDKELNA